MPARSPAATAAALLAALLLVAAASVVHSFVPPTPTNSAAAAAPGQTTAGPAAGAPPSSPAAAAAAAASQPLTRMAASASPPKKQQPQSKKRNAEAGGVSGGSGGSGSSGKAALKMKAPPPTAQRAHFGPGAPSSELVGGSREREAAVAAEEESLFHHLGEEHNSALQLRRLRSLGKWPVLVLNADCQPLSYLPLSVLKWQDAVKAVWLERVNVLEYYDSYVQSSQGPWQLPSVVCLKEYQKSRREHVALNRRNIYLRDKYECAFCLTRLRAVDLSLDHVHPRCKGGKSTWENLVTCCRTCNRKKGKRTVKELHQIGMALMKPPRRPTMSELQGVARQFRTSQGMVHESWAPYLGIKPGEEGGPAGAAGLAA